MKYVRSRYRSRWKGVVLEEIYYTYNMGGKYKKGTSVRVLLAYDKNGNPFKKKLVRQLGIGWLTEVEPFDISHLREDWFE